MTLLWYVCYSAFLVQKLLQGKENIVHMSNQSDLDFACMYDLKNHQLW